MSGVPIENQILAPARRGMVALTMFPGRPRGIAQLVESAAPVVEGEAG